MKRLFDLAVAASLSVALAPLMGVVALLIRLVDGPPVLFRQPRPGRDGAIFEVVKFRTMRPQDPNIDLFASGDQGARVTALGQLLRRTSLDELPQLWNVIRGDLSLVGPRPLHVEYLPLYTKEQARRHEVRPGITGWAQVNGRNALSWEERFALDVWYVDNRSFALDLRILGLTFLKVLKREGIDSASGHTMQPFRGTASPARELHASEH